METKTTLAVRKGLKFSSAWFNDIVNHYLYSAIVDLMRLICNMN